MLLVFDNHLLGNTCGIVSLGIICYAFLDVSKSYLTAELRYDDSIEWVPLSDDITLLHYVLILEIERRTVRHCHVREDNICCWVDEANFSKTAHYHLTLLAWIICINTLEEWNGAKLIKLDTCLFYLTGNGCICSSTTSDTTGVERTESQLSTRLTNSLCSDNADSLTLLHHALGSKVTSVALHT